MYSFHPLDHIIAFCSFGDSHPVLVYHYDPKAAKEEAKKFMTPPVTPSKNMLLRHSRTQATPDDVTRHVQMADVASDVLRMRKVKQKLDSVLDTPTLTKLHGHSNVENSREAR
ncbi:Jouberin [Desmophyllum pertusum]|uniref:Jouberin n=1 Tax=Desmophyllum pertusum TaxID=174260 RepID=A0A9W9ZW33_9CNID|nr:Jouberin [Desmophyllum pertusum]